MESEKPRWLKLLEKRFAKETTRVIEPEKTPAEQRKAKQIPGAEEVKLSDAPEEESWLERIKRKAGI